MLTLVTYKKPFGALIPVGFLTVYMVLAWRFVAAYYLWDVNIVCGLMLAPYICTVERGRFSLRYLLPAVLSAMVALAVPGRTPLFFVFLFAGLLFVENYRGKVSPVFFFLLVLCSPVFSFFSSLVGFPIRLWLSTTVAALLSFNGEAATAAGNVIRFDGADFSVDPACAGLNMLAVSFIVCLFMLAYRQRQSNRYLRVFWVVMLMLITFMLNVLSNLFRIIILILFRVMPGNVFHDLIGVFCLVIYVIIPLYFLTKLCYRHLTKAEVVKIDDRRLFTISGQARYLPLHFAFLMLLSLLLSRIKPDYLYNKAAYAISLKGYQKNILESGVIKFENHEGLIYFKPTTCYGLAHDPKICWTGSGYVFNQIKQESIGGMQVYTALLQKGKEEIYTAWWFDNGQIKTINQLNWRWRVVKGEREFYLINVNALTAEALKTKVTALLKWRH